MGLLQDFSICGLEESGDHSPTTWKHVHQGARGLEEVSLVKEGGTCHYGILECSSAIEGKKVSILEL